MASVTGAMQVVEDLLNAQTEQYMDKGKLPWSYDRPRNWLGLAMLLQNRTDEHIVDAGTDVVTLFDPEIKKIGGPKRPGAPHRTSTGGKVYPMRSALTEYEFGAELSWHKMQLNVGDPFTRSGSTKIWSIAEKANRDFTVGALKTLDEHIFAAPSAEMFDGNANGEYPLKSIFTGINEWTTAHYSGASGTEKDGLFPGMLTQQGLNPGEAKFARKDGLGGATQLSATKLKYATAGDATTGNAHLVERFGEMIDLMQWDAAPIAPEFAPGMNVRPRVVFTSREGVSLLRRTVRAHGELFAIVNPVGDLSQQTTQYAGIPVAFSDLIRAAAVYPDISGGVSAAAAAAPVDEFNTDGIAGARYYFIDPESVNIFMHRDRQFEFGPWKNLDQLNEDLYRRLAKMLGQLHFTRFATNGLLSPSADISGYAQLS